MNGNWNASFNVSFVQPIDHPRRLTLTARTGVDFTHSVDFYTAYDNEAMQLSRVNTLLTQQYLQLVYQVGRVTVDVNGKLQWRNASFNLDRATRNIYDLDYGATLNCTLPLAITLATDVKMYSRRGYGSDFYDTNDLIWNASLARSFVKGRLTLKLRVFDLLHQLTNVRYAINAQGRTETWQNSIPSYAMLSVAYKLMKRPKPKK